MKKDIYPDIRIEVISEGLTKKILESSGSPAPSVYGEEQSEGENLPNVSIKGKNKELQSVLETSNKKPTYTGLVKEAIQELRKDNHQMLESDKGTGKLPGTATTSRKFYSEDPKLKRMDDLRDVTSQVRSAQEATGGGTVDQERVLYSEENLPITRRIADELTTDVAFGRPPSRDTERRMAALQDRMPRSEGYRDARDPDSKIAAGKNYIPFKGPQSSTQKMVKEAIQELRKDNHNKAPIFSGPVGQEGVDPMDPRSLTEFETQTAAARDASKRSQAEFNVLGPSGYPTAFGAPIEGYAESSIGPEEKKLQSGGTDSGYGSGVGPGFRPEGFNMPAPSTRDFKPPIPVSELAPEGFDSSAVSSMSQATGTGTEPTSGEVFNREFEQGQKDAADAAARKAEADKLRAASALQSDDEPDDAPIVPPSSGPGEDDKNTGAIDEMAENIADNVGGTEGGPTKPPSGPSTSDVDPKITSEIDLGVRANPEVTRPKNSKGDLLPQFGSSGYFDAIISIGEGGENVEANYGVSNLSDFLSLYAQNPQFDKDKFLDNLGIEQPEAPKLESADIEKANPFKASLKKQAPPMAMTMNRPPNMGVGVQQPVVTGAGTMKNVEKDVAANKPAATPAKTKARRRKPKTIEMMVKSIADRIG